MKSAKLSRKIIAIALATALVGSMATVAAVSVSATDYDNFGIVGSPTNWGNELKDGTKIPDVKMVDPDGDKIFKGVLKDVPAGEVQFKVRTNNDWTDTWGEYEDVEDGRTYNSQTNCQLTLDVMSNIYVQIDTNGDEYWLWPVTYKAYVPQTKASSFGIIGSFPQCNDEEGNVWAKDVEMYDYDGDGVYTGVVRNVEAVEGGYDFKVRADGAWTLSWGVYEYDPANIEVDRTQNSQTNLHVDITDASDVIVTIDTTSIDPDAIAEAGSYANSADFDAEDTYLFWPVRYEVVPAGTAADPSAEKPSEEPVSPEEPSEEPSEEPEEPSEEPSEIEYPQYPDEDEEDLFNYSTNYDGTITVTGYNGSNTDVVIPSEIKGKTVTSIGAYAFNNSNIIGITIPDTVVSIGESAFEFCTSLENITIPDSVVKVGNYAFYCTPWLNNQPYGLVYIGKVAYAYIDNEDIGNRYNKQSIAIKEGTVSISDNAFSDVYGLTDIIIPDSVTYIGNDAFYNCDALTSITIPDSVTYIGNYAFYSCDALTSITISKSVTYIGIDAFANCSSIENITVDANNAKYLSKDGVLFNKDITKLLVYPKTKTGQYTVPDTITSINSSAFSYCTGLTGITIPDSVNYIGKYAFQYCPELTSVKLPENITQISYAAFDTCSNLKSINIPNSVKFIDSYAFSNCSSLTDIKLPDILQYIGEDAFLGCTSLKSLTVPDSVVYIGGNAIGYYMDYDYWDYVLVDDFTIYGTKGSKAETYANNNGIKFISNLVNNSTISSTEIKKGESVTLNAVATGGTEPYTYAYYYKKTADTKWTTAKNWSSTSSVSIKPDTATTYDVCIKVKDANGTIEKKYFTVNVTAEALVNNSTISKTAINKGESVTLNASATGGTAPYQYAYYYKKASSSTWTTAKNWSSSTSVSITPATATTYDVCIKVKDAKGTIVKKYFKVNVKAPLANNSTISATTITKGNSVTLKGSATGGTSPYTYAYYYKKTSDTSWTTAKNYSSTTSVSIKPLHATTYDVCIKVKDAKGTIVKKYLTLTVK